MTDEEKIQEIINRHTNLLNSYLKYEFVNMVFICNAVAFFLKKGTI